MALPSSADNVEPYRREISAPAGPAPTAPRRQPRQAGDRAGVEQQHGSRPYAWVQLCLTVKQVAHNSGIRLRRGYGNLIIEPISSRRR
jgi:hypothetical protein